MTTLDWVIVAFVIVMSLWGFVQGLIVGALSLAGFALGALVGARLAPLLLSEGSTSPYSPLFALLGAIFIGGLLAMGLETLGLHLRGLLNTTLGLIDGVGGAVLLGAMGLGLAWLFGAVALQTPGARELRHDIQRSKILGELNQELPPSGGFLKALARFDPFPAVQARVPALPEPTSRIARDPDVRRASQSVVKILGTACGLGVQGSGWVAKPGLVVTNAHVVAGEDDTTVQVAGEGERHSAQAVWFDPRNDLAILRVDSIDDVAALPTDPNGRVGISAAIAGFPHNEPLHIEPGRLGPTITALSQDAYGRGPLRRRITSLRGRVRAGNSGGPMIDGAGRVVTTIFASSTGRGRRLGYGVPDTVVRDAMSKASGPVSTGPCTAR